MATTTKQYNPLDGAELATIIASSMDELRDKLPDNPVLQPHLTFPLVTFRVIVEIDSYPMSKPARIEVSRTLGDTQETAPDAIRIENDLPTYATERQPDTGGLIDMKRAPIPKIGVGEGTKPRGRGKAKANPVETEATIGDDGEPIVLNKF